MTGAETNSWLIILVYLLWFFVMTWQAARDAGRPVWLIGKESGRDLLAISGFRLGLALAAIWPVALLVWPDLAQQDPFSSWRFHNPLALPGHVITILGAMLAAAAQLYMGRSWRVGVATDAVGDLVRGGPYEWSRNPVFVGQVLMLAGLFFSIPSLPLLLALILFSAAAQYQVRQEEQTLRQVLGAPYQAYCNQVSRWFSLPPANP